MYLRFRWYSPVYYVSFTNTHTSIASCNARLSLCCAADTNRDEGKRMSDASRESDIYIMYSVCVCNGDTDSRE